MSGQLYQFAWVEPQDQGVLTHIRDDVMTWQSFFFDQTCSGQPMEPYRQKHMTQWLADGILADGAHMMDGVRQAYTMLDFRRSQIGKRRIRLRTCYGRFLGLLLRRR